MTAVKSPFNIACVGTKLIVAGRLVSDPQPLLRELGIADVGSLVAAPVGGEQVERHVLGDGVREQKWLLRHEADRPTQPREALGRRGQIGRQRAGAVDEDAVAANPRAGRRVQRRAIDAQRAEVRAGRQTRRVPPRRGGIVSQSDERATVSVRLTLTTDDEKTAQQELTFTTVRKTGWGNAADAPFP